ncbi:hypothetical protein AAFF_G00140840 [Aldrovandia affinis]|uniref:Uncharacterized protein n=1 Tax=Aldrovandia affinis TaxID=143900 RepID=A0AAD7TCG2_9TELE|nr:hypothetical protein AAFF_G00140840 [Aldrovandia affinis]
MLARSECESNRSCGKHGAGLHQSSGGHPLPVGTCAGTFAQSGSGTLTLPQRTGERVTSAGLQRFCRAMFHRGAWVCGFRWEKLRPTAAVRSRVGTRSGLTRVGFSPTPLGVPESSVESLGGNGPGRPSPGWGGRTRTINKPVQGDDFLRCRHLPALCSLIKVSLGFKTGPSGFHHASRPAL